ncbi:Putative phenylalanine aminotransferase [Microbacterium oxydans]|uniref:Aromatic amino acid aminotransferase n=1 Tax=Microbacterium oxydans TaxID=82380 RepID=A0A0F0L852_9MICO|nr:histidinol-phosphate transaminase [Microbacterium oxydans]KJL28864.1 putative phenylalanine aminotransferase [Microbacterium oxydans]CAH0182977.1 Putative phenylalanine aminotransferase [Microbacterium oxydans]
MPLPTRAGLDAVPTYRQGRSAPAGASKLSSNESPHPPLPAVIAAVGERLATIHRYPDMSATVLRDVLAERYRVDPAQVTVGAGSVELAAQLIHAVAGDGDEVMFAWRSFEAYPSLVRIAGATPVAVPLTETHTHDLDAMLAAITPRTRLIFVCNPNNPTGTVVGAAELERFVAAVPHDVLVVIDEAYVHFDRTEYFDRDRHQGAGIELFHRHPHVAVLHTFSKAYGLAGLRIGYALAPTEVAENQRKVAVPFGVTDLAQTAALASLDSERELAVRIDEVVQQRDRLHALLIAAGWPAVASQANFVWVPAAERTDELETLLREGGVITRAFPGDGVRISSGSADDVDRVAAALAASARTFHASAPEEAVV